MSDINKQLKEANTEIEMLSNLENEIATSMADLVSSMGMDADNFDGDDAQSEFILKMIRACKQSVEARKEPSTADTIEWVSVDDRERILVSSNQY